MELYQALEIAGKNGRAKRKMKGKGKRFMVASKEDSVGIYEESKGFIRKADVHEYVGHVDWEPIGE